MYVCSFPSWALMKGGWHRLELLKESLEWDAQGESWGSSCGILGAWIYLGQPSFLTPPRGKSFILPCGTLLPFPSGNTLATTPEISFAPLHKIFFFSLIPYLNLCKGDSNINRLRDHQRLKVGCSQSIHYPGKYTSISLRGEPQEDPPGIRQTPNLGSGR